MTNHEKFLDAMNGVDEKFLSVHIRKKCPTAGDKAKRYALAVAAYAAAIIAVAVILPFIIGKGEDPKPQPGKDPVVTETNAPMPDDPEVLPTESVTFNGCELSITLDRAHYDLDDTITATVVLENMGDETIYLYQYYFGEHPDDVFPLDDVFFLENGERRDAYSDGEYKYLGLKAFPFEPGDVFTRKVEFTPGKPLDDSTPIAKIESLWEITAIVKYDLGSPETNADYSRKATVTIEVPHGEVDTDTELRQIDVADIDAKYNGTDPEKYADKVTLDEVKAIISAARRAYAEYDVIVLTDGTLLPTKAKLQDYTLEQLDELGEDERDTLFEEYSRYFCNIDSIIREMVELRFTEESKYYDYTESLEKCFYVLNLPDTGYATAGDLLDPTKSKLDKVYLEWLYIALSDHSEVYYLDSNIEEREMLYPTAEEYEIRKAVDEWYAERKLPKAVAEFDGLRYTLSLDKENYGLDDEIVVRVLIENVGDKAVALWQPVQSHYIHDVRFYEDGAEKPEFCAQQWDYPEAEESRFLRQGQAIMIMRTFTPGSPLIDGKAPASIESLWEITAYVKYLPDPPEDLAELDVSKLKTGSVTIEVPHLSDGEEESPEVTTEPPIETTTTTVPPPPETTTTTPPPETEPPVVIPPLEDGQRISGDFVMFENWVVKYFGNGGDVALPEGTTMIFEGAFEEKGYTIKSLHIPASFNSAIVGNVFGGLTSLQYYSVDENCSILEAVDGVLYNKRVGVNANAKRSLKSVPGSFTEFVVPADVEHVSWCAFMNCTNMNYIYVESENQTYTSYLGVVITKDRKQIVGVPPGIGEITVPAEIGESFLGFVRDVPLGACKNLRRFIVDSGNPLFSSVDGLLYSKDGTALYSVPGGVVDCSIPDGVTKIDWGAFKHTSNIANVYIPDSVTEISSDSFYHKSSLVIHCSAGSYAAKYAAENGIACVTE